MIRRLIFVAAILALQACGSSEEEDATTQTSPADTEYDVELLGSVGDGPIVNASLRVKANDGTVISNAVSNNDAGYNIQLRTKGKYYPLTIDATGGVDLVTQTAPGFTLISASTEPRKKSVANVNPFTTLAILTAQKMNGGLNTNNISTALDIVTTQFNAGMTSALSLDPMTIPIDDSNLAEIVKASEMLAEIFRRVQLTSGQAGLSIDNVIDALASDLTDGALDGVGVAGTDRKVTAATIVAASEVMLEAMVNQLKVGGQDVTSTLDGIVRQLATGNSPPLTASRPVTMQMIDQALRGIDAAIAIADTAALQSLRTALGSVTPGMSGAQAAQVLPTDPSLALQPTLTTLASASDSEIDTVITAAPSPAPAPSPSPNTAPVISGTPATSVMQDTAYTFTPTASDADGDALTFSVAGLPAWASFSAGTGTIAGTPVAADVGTHSGITITVSDGTDSASLGPFSITVQATSPPPPTNTPPVISGTPATSVMQDTAYTFTPTASDADGDALTFSVAGLPAWASFSAGSGTIAGTPVAADVGTYSGITITVSDGTDSASLGPFSITVQATVIGSATLSWVAPTQNTDGTPLTNLAGYKIYWGQQSGSYSGSTTIMNPGITNYVIDQLTSGTWYFTVTALNDQTIESNFSNEVSKTIN